MTLDPNLDLALAQAFVGGIELPAPSQAGHFATVNSTGNNLEYASALSVIQALALPYFPVEAYLAKGDGIADDTIPIQSAIDACRDAGGGIVLFSTAKVYRITTALVLNNTHIGVHLQGTTPHIDVSEQTTQATIRFDGPGTTGCSLKIRRRGTEVQRLKFDVAPGKTARSAVEIDNDVAGGGLVTDIKLRDCLFLGANGGTGTQTYGVVIGIADPSQGNQDFMRLERCRFEYQATYGFYIASSSGQSKSNVLADCVFYRQGSVGIYVNSGSYVIDGTLAVNTIPVAIQINSAADTIDHMGHIDSEACGRLFVKNSETVSQSITFRGGRIERDGLNGDGEFLQCSGGGPIVFEAMDFCCGVYSANWRASIGNATQDNTGRVIFRNCIFPNETPLKLHDYYDVTLEGCVGYTSGLANPRIENQRLRSSRPLEPAESFGNPVLWLQPSEKDCVAVFDVATQVARYSQVNDRSGLSGNALQATGANQPKMLRNWRAGKPAMHFDSTARNLVVPTAAWLNVGVGSWLILMAAEWVGASAFCAIVSKCTNASPTNIECFRNGSDQLYIRYNGVSNYAVSTLTWPTATPSIVGWGVDAVANQSIYVRNGTIERAAITVSGTGSNAVGLRLNGDNDGNSPNPDLRIGEMVMINRGAVAISTAEIQAAVAGLRLRWQI